MPWANAHVGVEVGAGGSRTVGDLLTEHPEAMAVLERFGIRLDPFTIIALRSTVRELAEYSAVEPAHLLEDALAGMRDGVLSSSSP